MFHHYTLQKEPQLAVNFAKGNMNCIFVIHSKERV